MDWLKKILNWIFTGCVYIGSFILLFFITLFMFWPVFALAVIFMCIFWFLLPVITWILLGVCIIFIFLYIIANLN